VITTRSRASRPPERPRSTQGGLDAAGVGPEERALSPQELDILIPGFRAIRDQEPRDDVADWANAVVALLEDGAGRNSAN